MQTYIYVIPNFQCMSFTFNVKKSLKINKIVKEKSHYMKKRFRHRKRAALGKVCITLIL